MARTKKIWAKGEPEPPDGVLHLSSAPPNWFREEPAYAAELYGLELSIKQGPSEYLVYVLDEDGATYAFEVKLATEIVARVKQVSTARSL